MSYTSSTVIMGVSLNSYIPLMDHDRMDPKVIPLSHDFDSERASGNSLEEGAF